MSGKLKNGGYMKSWILSTVLLAAFAVSNYFSYDYGATTTDLAWQNAQSVSIDAAATDREAQAKSEAPQVAAAIDNAAARDLEVELLKEQVAHHEAEIQRTNVCNLSADTIVRMQQFAKTGLHHKQLEPGARISAFVTACGAESAGDRKSSGDGDSVFRQRFTLLGYCVQPYRSAAGGAPAAARITI
jgi:hypothetical protein